MKEKNAAYWLEYKADLQKNVKDALRIAEQSVNEIRCGENEKEFSIIIYCNSKNKTINISKDDKALNCISPRHYDYDDYD